MDPAAYEQRLQLALEDMLADGRQLGYAIRSGRVSVDAARLEGTYPHTRVILRLTSELQPECRFGFSARVWNAAGRPSAEDSFGTPEEFAWIMTVHLQEIVEAGDGGLPTDCVAGEVTWVRGVVLGTYFD